MKQLSNEELLDTLRSRLITKDQISDSALLQQLEEVSTKLKLSEQLKSGFLSNVRNEIINPLSSILGLSKYLAEGDQLSIQQLKHNAQLLHREAFNLDFQIRNIIAAAEIEAGLLSPEFSMLDMKKLTEDILESIKHRLKQKNLKVDIEFGRSDKCSILTDAAMIHLIIANLIANAIEFSPQGGKVIIAFERGNAEVALSFRDFGTGIHSDNQRKIFDRFIQLDDGSTKEHNGHGLGLCVVKEFAEVLSGSIQVESSPLTGSVFTVRLPSKSGPISYGSGDWNEVLFGDEQQL